MNKEPSIFPEIKIIDVKETLRKAVAWTTGMLAAGRTTELCLSEHNRGASPMLDAQLDEPDDGFAQGELFGS